MEKEITIRGSKGFSIPLGAHKGTIVEMQEEQKGAQQFPYLDIQIRLDDVQDNRGNNPTLVYGCPVDNVTPNSRLGKLLMKFGLSEEKLVSGEPINVKDVLMNKSVELVTMDSTNDRGTFATVVEDSVNPLKV